MRKGLIVLASVLALVTGGVAPAVPAVAAGGWAMTYVDPHPSRFEAGRSYAVGFWVLQHGTHPFEGRMRPVGLRFTRADGRSVTFDGTALPEAAHYAASVVVPEGVWRVEGVQGPFEPYGVGTLTVPGPLRINPVPSDLLAAGRSDADTHWDTVRPPGFGPGGATPADAGQAPVSSSPVAVSAPVAPPRSEPGEVPAYALLLAAVGGAVLAVAASRLTAAARRGKEEERDLPADDTAETIVISGSS
ncbi:hypothetical protein GCM10022224_068460 [Nonomuraea antimicrobica]|uniref:Htaa protein n=1 Tax=Nonomuraea antimicrobica TaxID=561173 RepID=A0ABP7CMM1_9ACTN